MRKHQEVDPSQVSVIVAGIGPTLRRLRERRELTLSHVAELVGVNISTLSRLESGDRAPVLELLLPLAQLYNVALDDIVGAPPTGDPRVHPRTTKHGDVLYIALTNGPGPIQAFKMILPGGQKAPTLQQHRGYEWLYVLRGRLELVIDGFATIVDTGEAAEFDTTRPHGMRSTDENAVEVLGLFSPQGERVHIGTHAHSHPN